MSIECLDPGYEENANAFVAATRLTSLAGTTIGLISNGKEGTRRFFQALELELIETHKVGRVVQTTKQNYSAPAEPAVMTQVPDWQAVISGVGD